ncbi:MAG TPA: sulfatase-like hydrolase/transferase, partial [Acidobacteriaceae bacterium]|nr:sulfatase-like hydrolase/transferase [Acidobacteriaceae bacterium]
MDRRNFLAGAAVATLSAAVGAAAQPAEKTQPEPPKGRRPNVLLLMSDQHRRGCMGAFGDPVAITPNLDAFARESVRFTNVYCTNPVCGPSRASMLTGLFTHHLGDPGRPNYTYASRNKTMPGRFSQAGYFTGLIGKMHFGDAQLHGFDYELEFNDWFQFLGPKAKLYADELGAPNSGAGQPQIQGLWHKGDPWKGHREPDGRLGPVAVGRPSTMEEEDHFESFVADQTVKFLETYAEGDQPFFLVSSLLKPHDPFMPAKRFAQMFPPEKTKLSPTWGKADLDTVPKRVRHDIESCHYTPELRAATEAQKRTAYYYGNLAQMDDCAGKILDALKRLGLDENTIVVYT